MIYIKRTKLIGVLSRFVGEFPEGTTLLPDGDFIVVYHPTSINKVAGLLKAHGLLAE